MKAYTNVNLVTCDSAFHTTALPTVVPMMKAG